MFEAAAPYLVAVLAMLFSGTGALTLIYAVSHFDPPEVAPSPRPAGEPAAV